MKTTPLLAALALLTAVGCADSQEPDTPTMDAVPEAAQPDTIDQPGDTVDDPTTSTPPPSDSTPLAYEMPALDGTPTNLADYQGQVVLIVNTASQCGLTPQYQQLQELYEHYRDDGFTILAFPANNFGGQEPGSDTEIAAFCEENYGVGFDMFSKISVKGDDQHPLYTFLTSEDTNPQFAGEITWNFEKFLLDREGNVIARFEPRTRPDAPEVVAAIEAELAKLEAE